MGARKEAGGREHTVVRDENGNNEAIYLLKMILSLLASICSQHKCIEETPECTRRTPMIPAMTTGMEHLIIRSGLRTAIAEMPTPDFAVP